jgi:hypothetical protein
MVTRVEIEHGRVRTVFIQDGHGPLEISLGRECREDQPVGTLAGQGEHLRPFGSWRCQEGTFVAWLTDPVAAGL